MMSHDVNALKGQKALECPEIMETESTEGYALLPAGIHTGTARLTGGQESLCEGAGTRPSSRCVCVCVGGRVWCSVRAGKDAKEMQALGLQSGLRSHSSAPRVLEKPARPPLRMVLPAASPQKGSKDSS